MHVARDLTVHNDLKSICVMMMMIMMSFIKHIYIYIWYRYMYRLMIYIRVLEAIKALAAMKELVEETHITTHATHSSFKIHHFWFSLISRRWRI